MIALSPNSLFLQEGPKMGGLLIKAGTPQSIKGGIKRGSLVREIYGQSLHPPPFEGGGGGGEGGGMLLQWLSMDISHFRKIAKCRGFT